MSAKKGKGGGREWIGCPKCQKRFPRSNATKHDDSDCRNVYPFIHGGSLHATLDEPNLTIASRINILKFTATSRLSSCALFLTRDCIRQSGFLSCSWVSVTLDRNSDIELSSGDYDLVPIAFKLWPIPESDETSSTPNKLQPLPANFASAILSADALLVNRYSLLNIRGKPVALRINSILDPMQNLATMSVFSSASSVVLELEDEYTLDRSTFDSDRFIDNFKKWFRNRLITQGNQFQIRFYAEVVPFRVKEIGSNNPVISKPLIPSNIDDAMNSLTLRNKVPKHKFFEVTNDTEVQLLLGNSDVSSDSKKEDTVTLEDVGGLDVIVNELCSNIKFIFNANMNIARGVLLYGHSGVGKTFLVQALCNHFNLHRVSFDEFRQLTASSEHKRLKSSSSSNSLEKAFRDAVFKAPAAIIIENLDALAPKKSVTNGLGISSTFAANLSSLIQTISFKFSKIIIIATATDVDGIDSTLRSPKIFGKEIELPVPSAIDRQDILKKICNKFVNELSQEQIKEVASMTHGFVGADLQGLCVQAAQSARERCQRRIQQKEDIINWNEAPVTVEDLKTCLKSVKPSAIKSILVDVPNVRYDDIGGQRKLKDQLKQVIEWPLTRPDDFKRLGITPSKGVLMYGPPGCSKTMIAKAIATESGLNFISVKGSELFSKWVGESEKAVRDLFKKARQVAPCVVFFDEIDSLGGERGSTSGSSNVHERVLAQLLIEVDGIELLKDVTIIAATNRPDIIDPALLRPGRFDKTIYVPLPDPETRRDILRLDLKNKKVDPAVNIDKLVENTEGYSCAELVAVCQGAAMQVMSEAVEEKVDVETKCIQERHFLQALESTKPRNSKERINFYEEYKKSH